MRDQYILSTTPPFRNCFTNSVGITYKRNSITHNQKMPSSNSTPLIPLSKWVMLISEYTTNHHLLRLDTAVTHSRQQLISLSVTFLGKRCSNNWRTSRRNTSASLPQEKYRSINSCLLMLRPMFSGNSTTKIFCNQLSIRPNNCTMISLVLVFNPVLLASV